MTNLLSVERALVVGHFSLGVLRMTLLTRGVLRLQLQGLEHVAMAITHGGLRVRVGRPWASRTAAARCTGPLAHALPALVGAELILSFGWGAIRRLLNLGWGAIRLLLGIGWHLK
jgi:hypothetical protein